MCQSRVLKRAREGDRYGDLQARRAAGISGCEVKLQLSNKCQAGIKGRG